MSGATYVTTGRRRIGSIFLGALLGSAITAVPIAFITSEGRIIDSPADILFSFASCAVTWLVGIAAFAFPIWRVIETRRDDMGWRMAAVCGLILTPAWFVIVMVLCQGLFEDGYDPAFWSGAMGFVLALGAIVVAVIGCAVAVVMWRFASRRAVTPKIADTFS